MKKQSNYHRKKLARLQNQKSFRRNQKVNFLINYNKTTMLVYVIKAVFLINVIVACAYFLQDGHLFVAGFDFIFTVYAVFKFRLFHKSLLPNF